MKSSIATRVAAYNAVVLLIVMLVTVSAAWWQGRTGILQLALDESAQRQTSNLSVARELFDARFPGAWRVVAADPNEPALQLYNGNGLNPAFSTQEKLSHHLYKGAIRVHGQPEVLAELERISRMTGSELTIAQRIVGRSSPDPTVGQAAGGRALRLITTVTRVNSAGVAQRATLTMMPLIDTSAGVPVGAGVVLQEGRAFEGRAMVAGRDSWTRYEPLRDESGQIVGVLYGGLPFAEFTRRADEMSGTAKVFGVAALLAMLACLAVFVSTRRLLAPLNALRKAAERVARGDLDVHIEKQNDDEVGAVSSAFANLVAAERELEHAATRVAAGDLSVVVTPRSRDDALGNSVEHLRLTIQALVDVTTRLMTRASAGQLTERGDESQFQGAFQQLVRGMNSTLDAVAAPVSEASKVLTRVAERDLRPRMSGSYEGSYATIQRSVNSALEKLNGALSDVSATSEQVAAASQQIMNMSANLAENAAAQAGALRQVSTSLSEVSKMSHANAESADRARGMVEVAQSGTSQGVHSMAQLSEAVKKIKTASDATARILKTIDAIAFQTNLLALNAAVEAARAGEEGRGFAVVAEEVRALATRSAEAARSTAGLVEDVVRSAEEGVRLNEYVLGHLDGIKQQVQDLGGLIAQIAEASERQRSETDQLTTAVSRIDAVTGEVAGSAQESSSAATELAQEAAQLRQLVSTFSLDGKMSKRGLNGNGAAKPPDLPRDDGAWHH